MSEPLYEIGPVEVRYAGRPAPALSLTERLTIERGEVLAIVGPSGAGKSTLLRVLGCIERPTAGSIRFLGSEFGAACVPSLQARRRVSLVFQRPILLNASVSENVAYGLRVRGMHNVARLVAHALSLVHLAHLENAPARTLSGGEAQRVALARALVISPDVLLLDEPTANLDPHNVSLIEQIVREQHAALRTTFVIVTHNVFQARRLATRAGLLLNGKLVEVDDAPTFFDAPRDERTRAFVRGDMIY